MTTTEKTNENFPDINFYFWLGADGVESVDEDEFSQEQDREREAYRRWREVDLRFDGEDGGTTL